MLTYIQSTLRSGHSGTWVSAKTLIVGFISVSISSWSYPLPQHIIWKISKWMHVTRLFFYRVSTCFSIKARNGFSLHTVQLFSFVLLFTIQQMTHPYFFSSGKSSVSTVATWKWKYGFMPTHQQLMFQLRIFTHFYLQTAQNKLNLNQLGKMNTNTLLDCCGPTWQLTNNTFLFAFQNKDAVH